MHPTRFIDDRNRPLWKDITEYFSVTVEQHSNSHFYHSINEEEVTIHIPLYNGTIELFTHELLHLHLIKKGLTITSYLKDRLRNEPLLHWSLSDNLFEQVGNYFEHDKMLPLYLPMGFERDLFCESYYMLPCNEMSLQIIRSGMSKEIPALPAVDLFIHKYFAIKTCPNPDFIYDHYLMELQTFNPELYFILETFWNAWKKFDIEKDEIINFKSFTTKFMHQLGTWNILNIYAKQKERA
jgi:hypothetical protein